MTAGQITQSALMESVNGFDELAVDAHFGIDLYVGNEAHPMKVARAAVFIHLRHEGKSDTEAKAQAMQMTVTDLNDYFAPEPDEVMPDEPETEEGKGDSAPASEQANSPASA